jgi:uncharacterized membrane protein YjjB (DUF3815 family)
MLGYMMDMLIEIALRVVRAFITALALVYAINAWLKVWPTIPPTESLGWACFLLLVGIRSIMDVGKGKKP